MHCMQSLFLDMPSEFEPLVRSLDGRAFLANSRLGFVRHRKPSESVKLLFLPHVEPDDSARSAALGLNSCTDGDREHHETGGRGWRRKREL